MPGECHECLFCHDDILSINRTICSEHEFITWREGEGEGGKTVGGSSLLYRIYFYRPGISFCPAWRIHLSLFLHPR